MVDRCWHVMQPENLWEDLEIQDMLPVSALMGGDKLIRMGVGDVLATRVACYTLVRLDI